MSESKPIRVMLVDDHLMVRDGLRTFLSLQDDLEIVAEAGDGQEAIDLCAQTQPDVVLMDILMPGIDGPTATRRILADTPDTKVIALTSFVEAELVQRALQSGAISYLLKDVRPERLAQAIRDACEGKGIIDAPAAQALVQANQQALIRTTQEAEQPGGDLTERETEVLQYLAEGKENKEIAQALNISLGTVRFHTSNIYMKLGVSNRTEATRLALKRGLISS